MSGISLTASMRSNLLSLQNIARQQDIVQNRLATGLKVSSAIDNPSSYYTAFSLNNRAADLTALLDAMSQGIQTIKAASEAIDSGTKFLEQAKAVANQALETAEPIIAEVSTEEELKAAIGSGEKGQIIIKNDIVMKLNSVISLQEGQKLVGASTQISLTFHIDDTTALNGITMAENSGLKNLTINYTADQKVGNNASNAIFNDGKSGITLHNLNINVHSGHADASNTSAAYRHIGNSNTIISGTLNINLTSIRGGGNIRGLFGSGNLTSTLTQTSNSIINITSDCNNGIAITSGKNIFNGIVNINAKNTNSNAFFGGDHSINGTINFTSTQAGSSGGRSATIRLTSATAILNYNCTANAFSGDTKFSAVTGATLMTTAGIYQATTTLSAPVTISAGQIPPASFTRLGSFDASLMNYKNFAETEENKTLQNYLKILTQYNRLISDASYKGINLLTGQNLKINLNEDRSSKIDVAGVKADSDSLGLKTKEWKNANDIEKSISELESAIGTLRSFASGFGNYYNIVTTRQDFTENLINVLEEGADKLTLADMNQESANMLALQTSQQLAVNSLSLASQASQSILKLF